MYQGGGLPVLEGCIQSDCRTHGWRVCAPTRGLRRAGHSPERDMRDEHVGDIE